MPIVSRQRRRRSTRGTCSSSRAGCSCRTAARRAGRGTPPRCWSGPTCRRWPRRGWRARAARRRSARRRRPRRSARSASRPRARTIGCGEPALGVEPVVGLRAQVGDASARRRTSGVDRARVVASSATAFAPFSQNSACCGRRSGSGQAQLWQSKPSTWFTRRRVRNERTGPISARACRRRRRPPPAPRRRALARAHPQVGLVGTRRHGAARLTGLRGGHGGSLINRRAPVGGGCKGWARPPRTNAARVIPRRSAVRTARLEGAETAATRPIPATPACWMISS